MTVLDRAAILAAQDMTIETLSVPEWGGDVCIRVIRAKERDAFESGVTEQRGRSTSVNYSNIRARLCALAMCNESGERIFTDVDVNELGNKSGAALDRVFDAAMRLNRMRKEEIEELAKNSESGQSEENSSS